MKKEISNSAWSLKWHPPEPNKIRQEIKNIWRRGFGFLTAIWKIILVPVAKIFIQQEDGLDQWRRLEFNKPAKRKSQPGEKMIFTKPVAFTEHCSTNLTSWSFDSKTWSSIWT